MGLTGDWGAKTDITSLKTPSNVFFQNIITLELEMSL